jgi:hypothetical protein
MADSERHLLGADNIDFLVEHSPRNEEIAEEEAALARRMAAKQRM